MLCAVLCVLRALTNLFLFSVFSTMNASCSEWSVGGRERRTRRGSGENVCTLLCAVFVYCAVGTACANHSLSPFCSQYHECFVCTDRQTMLAERAQVYAQVSVFSVCCVYILCYVYAVCCVVRAVCANHSLSPFCSQCNEYLVPRDKSVAAERADESTDKQVSVLCSVLCAGRVCWPCAGCVCCVFFIVCCAVGTV